VNRAPEERHKEEEHHEFENLPRDETRERAAGVTVMVSELIPDEDDINKDRRKDENENVRMKNRDE
jgi:hypothetical protein